MKLPLCVLKLRLVDLQGQALSGAKVRVEAVGGLQGIGDSWLGNDALEAAVGPDGWAVLPAIAQGAEVRLVCSAIGLDRVVTVPGAAEWTLDPTVAATVSEASAVELPWFAVAAEGAVSRNFFQKLSDDPTVKDFGAIGDGKADDTAAFRAAMAAVGRAGGQMRVPAGRYMLTGSVQVPPGVHLVGAGAGGCVLDFGAASGAAAFVHGACLRVGADSWDEVGKLAAPVMAGETTIRVTSGSANPGDIVQIQANVPNSYSSYRPAYMKGECGVVLGASGGGIELMAPLHDSYGNGLPDTPASVVVRKLSRRGSSVRSLTILPPAETLNQTDYLSPLKVESASDFVLDSVQIEGTGYACVVLQQCFGVSVTNCSLQQLRQSAGLMYGIVISNCQNVTVESCEIAAIRHAVTLGGVTEVGAIVNRHVIVLGCRLSSNTAAAGDAHGNSEFVTYANNHVTSAYGGFSVGGNHVTVRGNTIVAGQRGFQTAEKSGCDFVFADNRVVLRASDIAFGVLHPVESGMRLGGTLVVSGNQFNWLEEPATSGFTWVLCSADRRPQSEIGVCLEGNSFSSGLVRLEGTVSPSVGSAVVRGNTFVSSALWVTGVRTCTVSGNDWIRLNGTGLAVSGGDSVVIDGNRFGSLMGMSEPMKVSSVPKASVSGNQGFLAAGGAAPTVTDCGTVTLLGNSFSAGSSVALVRTVNCRAVLGDRGGS